MPLPKWLAQVNKRTFNKLEIKRGVRPILTHTGRASGKTYHTPLDAHRIDDGFLFVLNYGADSDWAQNVLAAGAASLRVGDARYDLTAPRVVSSEAACRAIPAGTKVPPAMKKFAESLRVDVVT